MWLVVCVTADLLKWLRNAISRADDTASAPSLKTFILSEAGSSAVIRGVTRTSPNSLAGKVTSLDGSV
ncbi:hypothetical protein [Actinoplanes sp. URMC 104]|uniref:hypothetical protein n=1 Tax=Actinoplanes sp. URMC 104 TaxID=3423409 RepID=UPI003F19A474